MKSKRALKIVGGITVIAFASMAYCFYLMTVPLDYDWVVPVLIGFILSLVVFVIALITLFVMAIRLRRARETPPGPS